MTHDLRVLGRICGARRWIRFAFAGIALASVAGAQAPDRSRAPASTVTHPDEVFDALRIAVASLESRDLTAPDAVAGPPEWTRLERLVARASREAGTGLVCAAAETLAVAVRGLHGRKRVAAEGLLAAERDPTSAANQPTPSDRAFQRIVRLGSERRTGRAAVETAVAAHGRMLDACSRLEANEEFAGVVAQVDDVRRRLRTEDGLEIALAAGLDVAAFGPRHALFPGAKIEGSLIRFDDGAAVATELRSKTVVEHVLDQLEKSCLRLGFAPAQKALAWDTGTVILHPVQGYAALGGLSYQVEAGSRIGALSDGCPSNDPSPGPKDITRRWLEIRLTYRPWGASNEKTILLAIHLQPEFPEYIALPKDASAFHKARLEARSFIQNCAVSGTPLPPVCDPVQLVAERDYGVVIRPWGYFCEAELDSVYYDVDAAPHGFRPARVVSFHLESSALLAAEEVTFEAIGHRVEANGNPASLPSVLGLDEPFAMSFNLGPSDPDPFQSGVDREASLYWPQVRGTRNGGFPFRFSCRLPRIARDVLAFCATDPPTFYKLPFDGPLPFRVMGQGNNSDFTHNGLTKYAFDFRLPEGEPVLAARAGTVDRVVEDQMFNCLIFPTLNEDCIANTVDIRHEDETIGRYVHFPYKGIKVEVGDEVERGDLLGWVGNTGNSTNPHIHLHTIAHNAAMSIPIRFELYQPGSDQVFSCLAPRKGDTLSSTNQY